MAADYSILQNELTKLLSDLKRELHMREVRKLAQKHQGLAKNVMQKKLIKTLDNQVKELQPTISRLYSYHHALKDNEIKGYLIYLLQMKEHFTREVATKQEMIAQRKHQIKSMVVKLCAMRNEYARKKRSTRTKTAEFVKLDNMSCRMNQIEKRICTVQQETKEIKEDIANLRIFLKQYKKLENDLLRKINDMKDEAQKLLDTAVTTYEEREEYINRWKIFKERYNQDLRKAAINQNALDLCLERSNNYDNFGRLQKEVRTDARIAITGDLIEKDLTGLESGLESVGNLHSAIAKAAGQESPKDMEKSFKSSENTINSMFAYLDELVKKMHHLQATIDELRTKNSNLLKRMTTDERRMRWEIKELQEEVQERNLEANKAGNTRNNAREELDASLALVRNIYTKCCPEEAQINLADEKGIDDTNVADFMENMEKKIVGYLMFIEYLRMQKQMRSSVFDGYQP
ncbi:myosin-J heavy chain-like isoform X2 [Stegodyphus dumicola]|uniref:myosin-J heavy chain-like isoform X2 n=1 Tax=Stegodyphus dumicola TaxID=202533 RepID=UPI0015A7E040|nr:myosin-J heavy chain-like isoform X2 [Stegodyphus dumicola]